MFENRPAFVVPLLYFLLLATVALSGYHLFFWDRVYPGVSVAGAELSGKTRQQAAQQLTTLAVPALVVFSDNPRFEVNFGNLGVTYDAAGSALAAWQVGRQGGVRHSLAQKIFALTHTVDLALVATIPDESIENATDNISQEINLPPTEPSVSIEKGQVVVNKGKDGIEVDREVLRQKIRQAIVQAKHDAIPIPLVKTKTQISDQEAETIAQHASKLIGKKLELKLEHQRFVYSDRDLVSLLAASGLNTKVDGLVTDIKTALDRPPQDARFVFQEGRVKEFTPAKDGLETDTQSLKTEITQAVSQLAGSDKKLLSLPIPVKRTKPVVSIGEVNSLGIQEVVGRGSSRFAGSIPSRIHNIVLAAAKLNGILLPPGETLSFNQALGDVSAYTGYQQAYVIKDGKTILGDGGGVCQVSTTIFRAALAAGLPILERRAHSYRVGYYEQDSRPGLDATVYSPTTDLKIKNDTPGHVLIQTSVDRKTATLVFELYGTADGRVSQILPPRVWDIVPAPPPLYQDDPGLSPGTTKQTDWAAPGSKAAFDYRVVRAGEVLQNRTFYSNYRPWQAVYLRGIAAQ